MAIRSYTSRSEFEQYHFNPVVTVFVPFALILIQAYLPALFPRLLILDLPLIAVIFFAVARRNPIMGAITGASIGLFQDMLTGQPIGINGIAKTIIGYAASSIGLQVDVENITTRILMNFGFRGSSPGCCSSFSTTFSESRATRFCGFTSSTALSSIRSSPYRSFFCSTEPNVTSSKRSG